MNWNELFSHIKSYLEQKNCARTLQFLKNCAAYHSKKEACLYYSKLLAILYQGLEENEAIRLRQLYKRKLTLLEKGRINSRPETSTDISILCRVNEKPGTEIFMKEIDRFFRHFDKKEKKLLNLDAPFENVDAILIDYCQKKIKETQLLEEIYPHSEYFTRLLKDKKAEIRTDQKLSKRTDKRRKIYPEDLIKAIENFGGISPKFIWQEGEDTKYEPGTIKYKKLTKELLKDQPELSDLATQRTIERNFNMLLNSKNYYSVKKEGDKYICVT